MKTLTITYDVTDLTDDQIACLEMEAAVQAEESEPDGDETTGHPSVRVLEAEVKDIIDTSSPDNPAVVTMRMHDYLGRVFTIEKPEGGDFGMFERVTEAEEVAEQTYDYFTISL